MWKTKFTSHKQHLCCLFFSRNVKTKIQTKVYYIFLVHFSKRNGSQTFTCSTSNKPFVQCICYWYKLLRTMLFILCDNWKTLFFMKIYRYSEGFSSRHVATFFKRSVLKEVCILCYLYNTVTAQCQYQSLKIYFLVFTL